MRHHTGIFVLWGTLGAVACGGASQTDFSSPLGASGMATTGGTNGSGGSGAKGGASMGGASSGKGGGTSTGGSVSTGGGSGTSGTAGDATGGTSATGGTGGASAAGGTGGTDTTGGTDATGGSGGSAGTGASGGTTDVGGSAGMGGTGMTTGGSAGSGMQAGGSGGMVDCDALETDYSMTLEQAEVCNPSSDKDQCTQMENNDLVCGGCSVYVNPNNQTAVMHLDELRKEAGTNCVHPCPAIACLVQSATCVASSGSKTTGRCTSQPATAL